MILRNIGLLHLDYLLRLHRKLLWCQGLAVWTVTHGVHHGLLELHHLWVKGHLRELREHWLLLWGLSCLWFNFLFRCWFVLLLNYGLMLLLVMLVMRLLFVLFVMIVMNLLFVMVMMLFVFVGGFVLDDDQDGVVSNFRLLNNNDSLNNLHGRFGVIGLRFGLIDHLLAATLSALAASFNLLSICTALSFRLAFSGFGCFSRLLLCFFDRLHLSVDRLVLGGRVVLAVMGLAVRFVMLMRFVVLFVVLSVMSLLSSDGFCLFGDNLYSLFDEMLFVLSSLGFACTLALTNLLLFLALSSSLGGFDASLALLLLLLLLMLSVLALAVHLLFAVTSSLLLLLASLGLVPVELFEVGVLLGCIEALKVGVNLLWNEVLRDTDVHNLVVVQDLAVNFTCKLLVVLHDIPLLVVEFNELFIRG